MIDPLLLAVIALCMGMLFTVAGGGKLRSPGVFQAVLGNYQVIPAGWLVPAARVLPVLELALGLAWLTQLALTATAIGSAALLLAYAGGMAVNLGRGRVDIDCGCSPGTSSRLSWWLVWRNVLLATVALAAGLPSGERSLAFADGVVAVAASATVVLVYLAAQQLIANGGRSRYPAGRTE